MSKNFNQIVLATDTFAQWLQLTNDMANAYHNVVTTAANSSGDYTTGNAFISGIFGGNTVVVYDALRGGNVATAANLTITSNVAMTGANSSFTSNVYINASNVSMNANTFALGGVGGGNAFTISTNSTITNSVFISHYFNVTGNTRFINSASFSNTVSITGSLSTINTHSFVTATNAILSTSGANTVTASTSGNILVDSFDGSVYRGGKYVITVKDTFGGIDHQMTEVMLMHDGAVGYTTEYATLRTGQNLAVFSANLNGTTVRLYSNSQVATSVYKVSRTLLAV